MNDATTNDDLRQRLVEVVHSLNASGHSWGWPPEEIGNIAIRRWRSFSRRNKSKSPTRNDRIRDLVKGLRAHFEPDIAYTHVNDWRALVEPLADVLEGTSE